MPSITPPGSEHPRVGGEDRDQVGQVGFDVGTPPRRRGGQPPLAPRPRWSRNTPASAGRTEQAPAGASAAPEHPRVGGEDISRPISAGSESGTPPRRRGGLPPIVLDHRPHRNTPASAGRTMPSSGAARSSSEHPRVGGEDVRLDGRWTPKTGTPPRRRGGRGRTCGANRPVRNTPALAGRTRARSSPPRRPAEHPRVGGEDSPTGGSTSSLSGTPPRRRGGPTRGPVHADRHRNTPASAGRTSRTGLRRTPGSEHPRVGGEDDLFAIVGTHSTGTPPRRRGGPAELPVLLVDPRNTPASAGRTPWLARALAGGTEHPRVGGEDVVEAIPPSRNRGTPPRRRGGLDDLVLQAAEHRNTPASAGRTPYRGLGRCGRAEHPRVGGEDSSFSPRRSSSAGTPPRRRGGPPAPVGTSPAPRNTPASAGRTYANPGKPSTT